MMKRESFEFHESWKKTMDCITQPGTRLRIYNAIVNYAFRGIKPDEDIMGPFLYMVMCDIDRDYKKYEELKERCQKARKARADKRLASKKSKQESEIPSGKFQA